MPGPQYVLSLSKNPAQLTGTIALKQKQNYHFREPGQQL